MKKSLAILLSLALVICMIPATAFGAPVSEKVEIGGKQYTVTFNYDTFSYNAKEQVPVPTLTDDLGNKAAGLTYTYKKADTEETSPKDAGTYDMYVGTVKIGDFKINPISLADSNIKIVAQEGVKIDSDAKTAITGAAVDNVDNTLKRYFKVVYGTTEVATTNYTLSYTLSSDSKSIDVTAKDVSDKSFTDSRKTVNFKFVSSLSDFTVVKDDSVNSTDFMYTGVRQDPTLKVYNGSSETLLIKGTDYTVSCTSETAVGKTVTVTVKGIGSYTGEIQKDFVIEKFDISKATVTPTTIYVPEKATSIEFTLKGGNTTLVGGRDYTVGALDTAEASNTSKTVEIKGQGNYTGTKNVSYTVVSSTSKDIALSTLTMGDVTYNGSAQAPSATLKVGANTVPTDYYTVEYRVHGASSSYSATKPTNVGVYDVQIKLTKKGTDAEYNNAGSKDTPKVFESAFEIKPLDIASSTVSAVYGGTSAKPVIVKHNGKELVRYYDYDVEDYAAYRTVYTVQGKGNFTGTKTVYTSIKNISSCTINFSDNRSSVAYGPTYYPKVTVYDYTNGKTPLYEKTDYTLTYKNSKNQIVDYCKEPGTYSVIVTGKGAYTGTKTLIFTIGGTDISNYTVTLKESSVNVTGYAQTPVITSVKYGYTNSLTSNDYTVTYQDENGKTVTTMSAPGTYKVVVTGKNGYSGSTYTTFRIVGKPQTVTVDKDSYKKYPTSDYFKITASATGDGTGFTYTSNNPSVASVSSSGYVTIHKVGRAVITVKATGMKMYEPASKTVEVKVYPNKAKLSRKPWTDGKKGQMKVRWGYQDGVTKYQIRYSRDKNFSSGSYLTKTVKAHGQDYTTQSTTISNLKRGYTYYFKVRAVYTDPVTGDSYYGSWSSWRSAKTI